MKKLSNGNIEIGTMKLYGRKRQYLYITKDNQCEVLATFRNDECADRFIDELAKFIFGCKE